MLRRSILLSFVLVSVLLAMVFGVSGCGEGEPPVPPADIIQAGLTLLEAEDYEGAMAKFDEALTREDIGPAESAGAYVGLGWANGRTLNLQESIVSFQSALSQDSQNADAHAGIAFAYLADDKYDQAIDNANQALAINPNYSFAETSITSEDLNVVLAESYYYKGEFEEVKRVLDITEEVSPAELLEELEAASGG